MKKGTKVEGIIYQKILSKILTSLSMEKTFTTNPLSLVLNGVKK